MAGFLVCLSEVFLFFLSFLIPFVFISVFGGGFFGAWFMYSGFVVLVLILCLLCIRQWLTVMLAEVKALKSLVRNVIAPDRDLGHTDRALKNKEKEQSQQGGKKECEDCV